MPLRLFWGHVSHRGISPARVCKVSWATAWTFTFSQVEWGLGQRQFWIYDSSRSVAQCQAQCQCSRNSCHAFPQLSGQAHTWMEEPQCCWEGKHWGEAGTWESQELIHSILSTLGRPAVWHFCEDPWLIMIILFLQQDNTDTFRYIL